MNRSVEGINAGVTQAAGLGFGQAVGAGMALTGRYMGLCRGYKDAHRDEYLREWPRLQAMRARRDRLLRWVPRVAHGALTKFLDELAEFERYMESLTEIKWLASAPNLVTTVGKNLALDTVLAGSGYTVTGPYMGIIGAVSYAGVPQAADTMSSHSNWTEGGGANAPTYSGNRATVSWSSAAGGSKSPSSAPVFTFTGTGTAKGVFLALGSGASATKDNTSGTLYSAGLFTGGDQAVVDTNTLTVTYTASA